MSIVHLPTPILRFESDRYVSGTLLPRNVQAGMCQLARPGICPFYLRMVASNAHRKKRRQNERFLRILFAEKEASFFLAPL